MTLIEFLSARLDEDEATARAVITDQHGLDCDFSDDEAERHESWEPHPGGDCPTGWQTKPGWEHNHLGSPSYRFIRHVSPERAVREVDAKRAIMDACYGREPQSDAARLADVTLAHLAATYADHADYREEWKLVLA